MDKNDHYGIFAHPSPDWVKKMSDFDLNDEIERLEHLIRKDERDILVLGMYVGVMETEQKRRKTEVRR